MLRPALRVLFAVVRLHWMALCIAAGLMLAYALFGFFLVPRIARSQAQDYVATALHKRLSVGEVRFNPFTFDASVSGLRLTDKDDSLLLGFGHLYVNAELASLWQRALVLKEVQLAAPDVRIAVAADGAVNLATLIPASQEPSSADTTPPRVRIGRLSVTAGRITFEDRTRTEPFTAVVAPVRFTLTDFRTDADYRNAYRFAGTTAAGETLEWAGGFTVHPFGSTGNFKVTRMRAATIDAYVGESLPFSLASGAVTLEGSHDFRLDPLALDIRLPTIAVADLSLAERANRASAPVVLPEIAFHDVDFSYAKRDVVLRRIDVKRARVDLWREAEGSINLARLFGQAQSAGASRVPDDAPSASSGTRPPSQVSDSSSWNVRIDTIHVDQASILAEDRTVMPVARLELAPASFTVSGWRTAPGTTLQVDADVTMGKRGRLRTSGALQLEPVEVQLALQLSAFDLPVIQPYLEEIAALTLHSGQLDVQGDLQFSMPPESRPSFRFNGDVRIADLRTTDNLVNEDLIKWRDLRASRISFDPKRLTIERVVARRPYASVIIADDSTLNIAKVLQRDESPPGDERSASSPPPESVASNSATTSHPRATPAEPIRLINIRSVQIVDGSARFADYSIEPSFAAAILGLNGSVTGLSSTASSRAKIQLAGNVDKYAPVDIAGEINLLAAAKYSDIAMNFRNMELTTFNPYSGKFAGYNISKGKLSTELRYKVADRKLDAQHHVVLDNLEFGAKTDSKDAAPIPIKLAVALLKDRNGVIDLQVPVGGSLDDPTFRLGPIIWKAFLGLLTKIVTAPFAAIGALFGGGDELAYVDFPAGSAEAPAPETEKLDKLTKALAERPQLRLDVPLTVVAEEDSNALARRELARRAPEAAGGSDANPQRARLTQFEALYVSLSKTPLQYSGDGNGIRRGLECPPRLARIAAVGAAETRSERTRRTGATTCAGGASHPARQCRHLS